MAGIALKRSIRPCFHNGPSFVPGGGGKLLEQAAPTAYEKLDLLQASLSFKFEIVRKMRSFRIFRTISNLKEREACSKSNEKQVFRIVGRGLRTYVLFRM